MKRHAPGAPSGTKVDQLYDARSHITHGERLLHYDQPPGAAMLTQQSTADRQAGDAATLLCRAHSSTGCGPNNKMRRLR
jgi:hypothetical protein